MIHEGIIPCNLIKYGKSISISGGLTYIVDNESKREKLNTPVKEIKTVEKVSLREMIMKKN